VIQVSAAIGCATLVFYFTCRLLRVEELAEAVDAIGGKLLSRFTRR
jgi:hypothetical protein